LQGIGPRAMQEIEKLVADNEVHPEPEQVESLAQIEPMESQAETPVIVAAQIIPADASTIESMDVTTAIVEEQPALQAETEPTAAQVPMATPENGTQVVEAQVPQPVEEIEEELPTSLDEIFARTPEVLVDVASTEEEEGDDSKKGKKKKKKGKHVEVEYDPDRDLVMIKKKHKRGEGWDEWQ